MTTSPSLREAIEYFTDGITPSEGGRITCLSIQGVGLKLLKTLIAAAEEAEALREENTTIYIELEMVKKEKFKLLANCAREEWALKEVEKLKAEMQEQCRIIGMSGERELALLTEIAALNKHNKECWCEKCMGVIPK